VGHWGRHGMSQKRSNVSSDPAVDARIASSMESQRYGICVLPHCLAGSIGLSLGQWKKFSVTGTFQSTAKTTCSEPVVVPIGDFSEGWTI